MLSARFTAVQVLATVSTVVGCKPERASGDAPAASVNITAKDYAFAAPSHIRAGVTTIHLTNEGKELHHAQLIKLEQGKTIEDVAKALKQPGPPPSWVKFVGGPNAVPPGGKANATEVLAPGHYAYLCFVFGPDGVIHAAKGMMYPFEVTGDSAAARAELPAASTTIMMADYSFESSKPLTAGHHTIKVVNAGPQPHELALLRLAPGKKVEDFAMWAEGGMKGPPPAEPLGGVVFLDKGGSGTFTADLTPGNYGLICFVPDAKDGKPHLAHGMMKTITVN
jgi:plastocyanin